MAIASRLLQIIIAIFGLLSLSSTAQHWFKLQDVAVERGFSAQGMIGQANFRADVGGVFLAIGLLMLVSAWKRSRMWALATAIVVLSALAGRIVSLFLDGISPRVLSPIYVELLCATVMLAAFTVWKKEKPEGL